MLSEQKEKLEERKFWYGNGQLWSQEFYRDGKLEGERKVWHENGQLLFQEFYRDGKEEGERKSWYGNGQLRFQEFYRDGKWEGECKVWYENGQLWSQIFYRNGKLTTADFPAKKCAFLRLRKRFLDRNIFPLDIMLITDLAKNVY
jgi:antitoxin component YwqK of YwqJK toxin-antitoxin module